MNPYEDALRAMHMLLGELKESHWQNWIAQDILEWQDRRSVNHHLSAYGGMGSFNDLCFDDVWFGPLFDHLKTCCFCFAKARGLHSAHIPIPVQLSNLGTQIQGWRCLVCGYSAISEWDIDYFITHRVVQEAVREAAADAQLLALVKSMVEQRPNIDPRSRTALLAWIKNGGITVRTDRDWMRPCPACESLDTAVYRWRFAKEHSEKFVPSDDNLPLRSRAT